MSILDRPLTAAPTADREDLVVDISGRPDHDGGADGDDHREVDHDVDHHDVDRHDDAERSPFHQPPAGVRGMRIRRVRLRSVAKIASVFFVLGYITVVGTLVAIWHAALAFGFVETIEETVTTSLGLETFSLDGQALFDLVVIGAGVLAVLGLVLTVLLAFVYNAACAVFGGLAVETGPLKRRRRVFSLRDRRFITIRG